MPALEGNEEIKLKPEEIVIKRIKLNPRKKNKSRNRIKNFNSKQIIN